MYIELHARSAFSFLEGASLPEELAGLGAHFGMPAMALLDSDGVYGAPRFHLAAKKIGLKAHIGAEVTCEGMRPVIASHPVILSGGGGSRSEAPAESKDPYCQGSVPGVGIPRFARNDNKKRNDKTNKKGNDQRSDQKKNESFRLPLLVSSRLGYQNLCRLITRMKLRAKKGEGAVCAEELREHARGLICLTGGAEGPLAAALQQGGMDEARRCVDQLIGIFGAGNVYVELQRHFQREEETRNRAAIDIAGSLNLPLLATNGVCYAIPQGRQLCDAFTAIRNHRTLSTAGHLLSRNAERHLKSP